MVKFTLNNSDSTARKNISYVMSKYKLDMNQHYGSIT